MRVELTRSGSVRLAAACAHELGAGEGVLVRADRDAVHLTMLPPRSVGGLILKRTSPRGDRAVLVVEQIRDSAWDPGEREAEWDEGARTLSVPLRITSAVGGTAG